MLPSTLQAGKLLDHFQASVVVLPPFVPFVLLTVSISVGKTEFDGDPVQSFGGIDKLLANQSFQAVSELSQSGTVGWSTRQANPQGMAWFFKPAVLTLVEAGLRNSAGPTADDIVSCGV